MYSEPPTPETGVGDLRQKPSDPALKPEQLRADIAARLGRVRGEMEAAAFDALVDDICAMTVRWARKSRPDD